MPLFLTHRNWAATASRIAIAAAFIPQGLDKLLINQNFGWRGPEQWSMAFSQIAQPLTRFFAPDQIDILAQTVAWGQTACGALVLFGLLTRPAVIPLILMSIWQMVAVFAGGYWGGPETVGIVLPTSGLTAQIIIATLGCGLLLSGGGSISFDKLIACEPEAEDYEYQWEDEDEDYYDEDEQRPTRRR